MSLTEAREEFIRWDHLAVKFPELPAIQRARITAYQMWLQAVRNFRNGSMS